MPKNKVLYSEVCMILSCAPLMKKIIREKTALHYAICKNCKETAELNISYAANIIGRVA
ncbi:hypothetical protein TVAG_399710 [Trichomonas vaginalis G3]|uniref:Uncharacterized protein n=1 Tax=Trichomonas vaginalis (strain ATCC PRA-98 / G3) TaxID=412133 RepID=A2E608_TRIV3|nr:hypothetical protein TVAG_399710 [Trichomonas vaginalis G3]|eukprot:XP_001324188.1 hypothetical protein [Trichomonas vaginalis G3]